MRLLAPCTLFLAVLGQVQAAPQAARLTVSSISHRVALVYSEKNPHVDRVQKTRTESTYERMYFLLLSGHFHKGRLVARFIQFSALANRWYVWGIEAYNQHHRLLWADPSLPHRPKPAWSR